MINRIFFSSLLSIIFAHSVTLAQTSDRDFVSAWQTSYIDRMTPQELQITANLLYLLYANSIIEYKIRQFATPIARLQQSIRTSINTYQNATQDLTTLKILLDRLSYVSGARTIYAQTLKTGIALYGKNPTQMIEAAIAALQLDAQTRLRAWADAHSAETEQQLQKCSTYINDSIQHFQGVVRLHKGMSKGLMPIEISPENTDNKSLIRLSIILENNPELLGVTENVMNALNETTDHAVQIIQAGIDIYEDYYKTVYNRLMSCDKEYTTTLYSMYDHIPHEYKSVLPDAEHVFEHTLQTTKLYTQTEFLPS